jgi:C1A family cysteine protease
MSKELTPRKIKRYGWIPDLLDRRDFLYAASPEVLSALPSQVDLRAQCPPVYDQGQLGSCTANAIAAAIQFDQIKQKIPAFIPSRLFIYYNERVIEGTVASDSGAQIRDGIKSVAHIGACPETEWPYDIEKFADRPTPVCFTDAAKTESSSYRRLSPTLAQLKGCLASGFPFVFGITVYDSFESPDVAKTGHVPMPGNGDKPIGGHAILAVGYDDTNRWFLIRNSWGTKWGMDGYFTLPYEYATSSQLSSDFWTIRLVS